MLEDNSNNFMAMMNHLMNVKDSRWLQIEVCREFRRGCCPRTAEDCRFAHPESHVEVQNGRVTACYDSIKGKCSRENCKFLHPPQHLKDQLLINGKNTLALKNLVMSQVSPPTPGPAQPPPAPQIQQPPPLQTLNSFHVPNNIPGADLLPAFPAGLPPTGSHMPLGCYGTYAPAPNGLANAHPGVVNYLNLATAGFPNGGLPPSAGYNPVSAAAASYLQQAAGLGLASVASNGFLGNPGGWPSLAAFPPSYLSDQLHSLPNTGLSCIPGSIYPGTFNPPSITDQASLTAQFPTLVSVTSHQQQPSSQLLPPGSIKQEPTNTRKRPASVLEVQGSNTFVPPPGPAMDQPPQPGCSDHQLMLAAQAAITNQTNAMKRQAFEKSGVPVYHTSVMAAPTAQLSPLSFTYQPSSYMSMGIPSAQGIQSMAAYPTHVPLITSMPPMVDPNANSPLSQLSRLPNNIASVAYFDESGQLLETLPVCRDFKQGHCQRQNCRYIHLMEDYVEITNGKVTVCRDFAKGKCTRIKCKYYHVPALPGSMLLNRLLLSAAVQSGTSTNGALGTAASPPAVQMISPITMRPPAQLFTGAPPAAYPAPTAVFSQPSYFPSPAHFQFAPAMSIPSGSYPFAQANPPIFNNQALLQNQLYASALIAQAQQFQNGSLDGAPP